MESAAAENLLYYGIAIALVIVTVVMFIQGWMMKLAVRICGGDEIGVFYGVSTLTLSSLAGVAVSTAVLLSVPDVSPWISVVASFAGTIGVLCLMLRMGPLRAFGVYLTQLFLSILTVGATVIAGIAAVYVLVPADTLEGLANRAQTQMANVTPTSFIGFSEPQGQQADIKNLAEISRILNFDKQLKESEDIGFSQTRDGEVKNITLIEESLGPVLFGGENGEAGDKPEGSFKRDGGTVSPPSKADAKKDTMIKSPFDNKIRLNPFAN